MLFWFTALLLVALVAFPILSRLRSAPEGDGAAAAHDIQVYRDQLRDVERDRARGTLSEAEAEQVRTEVSRRILAADAAEGARAGTRAAPRAATGAAAVAALALLFAGSTALYLGLGAPGYEDLPLSRRIEAAERLRAERPSQEAAEEARTEPASGPAASGPAPDPEHVALVERLRETVAERPEDREGLALLARHEAALGNFRAAYSAQSDLVGVKGDAATAGDHARLAALLVRAAGGYVSPEAERAVGAALSRDPANGIARYYAGLVDAQTGRPDRAFRRWRALLEESAPGAPWVAPVRGRIEAAARRAGIDYELPAPAAPEPGGTVPAAQAGMIEGMVTGLAERLRTEGGSPAEWARLVRSYGVLGDTAAQSAALAEAEAAYGDDPEALARIRAAAGTGPATEVRRLSRRLAEEGGGPGDWARLIALLGRSGESGRARAIWAEAQATFADAPEGLARIREAAEAAGVAE